MGMGMARSLFILIGFLLSGAFATISEEGTHSLPYDPAFHLHISKPDNKIQNARMLYPVIYPETLDRIPERDVVSPTTTVPTINPTTPATTIPTYNPVPTPTNPYGTTPNITPTNPYTTTPTTTTPTSSTGQSWCVASPSASPTALQVALDYACGYGGADCSAIQPGGSCFNPDTLRDHASYAFNNYYHKNPVPKSCDFSGTAMITNTDPSTTACQYPSSSSSSPTFNPPSPTGPSGFGGMPPPPDYTGSSPNPPDLTGMSPPDYTDTSSSSIRTSPLFALIYLLISLTFFKINK